MFILIDGYNLLHAIGFPGSLSVPGNLELARRNTLDKLAKYLTEAQCRKTIVIFDSGFRSRERPKHYEYRGIRVEFSFGFDDADSMIEGMIRKHQVPEKLLVISSDHRIQNAARRRHARFMDSDQWMEQLEYPERYSNSTSPKSGHTKPSVQGDTEFWMEWMDGESIDVGDIREEIQTERSAQDVQKKSDEELEDPEPLGENFDPFPEGYGEDLLD